MAIKKVQLPDNSTQDINDARIASTDITQWNGKQDTLVSGTNIKTVNNESLLGSGNISVAGTPGEPGTDGVGISSVVQTTESTVSGGTNVITITKTDGTSSTFNVRNGDAVGSATIVQTTGDSTTSVMSQDATTTTISETKQHTLKVSPNSVFADNHKNGKIYSKRVFAFADIRNATAISRAVAYGSEYIVNHYEAYGLLGFYQSSTTFLQVYIQGGNIKVQLQVNGTMAHNEDIGTVYNTGINSYGDYAVIFDHDDLVFRIFGYSNGSVTQLVQYSISTWDLSSLSNVYLIASIDNYQGRVCCTTLLINSPSLLNNYIAAPLNVGEFNTPQGTPFKTDLYLAGTGINVAGTVVQTISDMDKIYSISNSSVNYWRVGPSNVANNSPYMWHHVKLRFSSLSDGAYLQGGILFAQIAIEANGLPSGLILSGADKFYPVVDTDYDLYVQYNSNNKDGAVQYAVKLYGTVTVEVSEPYCFNNQAQNICAETYDGDGFTGAIPCECDPVSLVAYKIGITAAPTNIRIPTYAKRVDSNGRIYMWNGSVWKQINNS